LFLRHLFSTDHKGACRWEIACSQSCGLANDRMKATYTIQTEEEFAAWLQEEAALIGQ